MAYGLPLTCPRCGADVEAVTQGKPIAGREVRAICRCTECPPHLAEWLIQVRVMPVNDYAMIEKAAPGPSRCGTDSGYRRHWRLGEEACEECKSAHARADSGRKQRRRQRTGVLV